MKVKSNDLRYYNFGAGAFAGMIAGGTIGLFFGPVGTIIGGLIGAIVGNQLEFLGGR
jgi:uncharacterized protein YqgC (DUF456 family)